MTDASSGSMRSKDIVTGAAVLPAAIEAASAPASDTDTTPDERFAKLSELAGTYLPEEDLGQLERAYRRRP